MSENRPRWLRKTLVTNRQAVDIGKALKKYGVRTVCESSLCPNLNECFSKKFATFLLLGPSCTRSCAFCSVKREAPAGVDPEEPRNIARAVKDIGLNYAVITSVTRDDVDDGGAAHFMKTVRAIKEWAEDVTIEVLIPDFGGRAPSIIGLVSARPDIIGHNIETVDRLYAKVRAGSDYRRSILLLKLVKDTDPGQLTKSGLMLGLGEREDEIIGAMEDLRGSKCDILTIGQYLRPGKKNLPVQRFVRPDEFERYRKAGMELGFKHVASGPFVRSSYLAEETYKTINLRSEVDCDTSYSASIS